MYQEQHVYWADAAATSVWRARYDGAGRARLFAGAPMRHVVALAVHRHRLYWLDT